MVYENPKRRTGLFVFKAEPYEWEPRAACYTCSRYNANGRTRFTACERCGGSGYVGRPRPPGRMLAWDAAWCDESHLRVIGPRTERRRGEALYEPHVCA